MKIGIVTIMDAGNYGNRLQNYAVVHLLERDFHMQAVALSPVTEKPHCNGNRKTWLKESIARTLCAVPRLAEKRFGNGITRVANFRKWDKHIPTTTFYEHKQLSHTLNAEYDCFLAGSDQIWNYHFSSNRFADFFLQFAAPEKRSAVSASFGVDDIPQEWQDAYIEGLRDFAHISVREDAGAEIIKKLLGRDVPVLIDPTMMLSAQEWLKVSCKPRVDTKKPYVLKYYLGDSAKSRKIDEWADKNGYAVYELLNQEIPELYSAGPGEFISLISNAALVCSDSFHCVVFSIIFKRPFVVFSRVGETYSMNSRLNTLLAKFGMESRWDYQLREEDYLVCDYSGLDQRMAREQETFSAYMTEILEDAEAKKKERELNRLAEPDSCTGCGACAAVCPKDCIEMRPDQEGFLHPVTDLDACIDCGLCAKVCPVLHPSELPQGGTKAFAAICQDEPVRMNSTSGGTFTALARWIFQRGGAVFGAAYQADFSVAHCMVTTEEELPRLRTAKYAQSVLGDTFRQAKALLDEGKYVLFSGTPCQIGGLLAYLRKPYEKLLLVDVICHGVPSPAVWQHYIRYRREQDAPGSAVQAINLRSKETGWPNYSIRFAYEDGTVYSAPNSEDPFLQGFVGDFYLRPSCYECPFKGVERPSDFTLADYWGIDQQLPEFSDGKGTSLVFSHSRKAQAIWEDIDAQIRYQEVDALESVSRNQSALRPSGKPWCRDSFWERYRQEDFAALVKEMKNMAAQGPKPTLSRRVVRRIKWLLHRG